MAGMKKETIREILITLVFVGAGAILALFVSRCLIQKVTVEGSSMVDTLHDGDLLFGIRKGVFYRTIHRYDVVVLDMDQEECYVKRIIGLPGETVQIREDGVYINGELLGEEYGYSAMGGPGIAEEEISLEEGEYFVLGDNREISKDSRDPEVGIIREEQVLSRLGLRIWPLGDIGVIK